MKRFLIAAGEEGQLPAQGAPQRVGLQRLTPFNRFQGKTVHAVLKRQPELHATRHI